MENGNMNANGSAEKFDPHFTQHVIDSIGPKCTPRMRSVMSSLIQHVHDFARENELTVDEWMHGVELLNWAGKMSDDKRNEGQLVCDIIGLESLVDEITFKKAADAKDAATASAILGPFFRHDAPILENETTIVHGVDDGEITYMHGVVTDLKTKKPVAEAWIDVWQASTNGLYEQQDANQVDCNLRGKFKTDKNGRYAFYCLRPTSYPVPNDGPGGKLLQLLDRHPYRPAHIHLIVQREGYKPVTTQIFDSIDKYLDNDSVFAVKDSLIVDFKPLKGNPRATLELEYPIVLMPSDVFTSLQLMTVGSSCRRHLEALRKGASAYINPRANRRSDPTSDEHRIMHPLHNPSSRLHRPSNFNTAFSRENLITAKMPFAEINDKSLFYTDDAQREGSSSQKTTVFIHGLGSSSCFYKIIIPHLQSVTRCIALDTPGSGLSELGKSEQSVKSVSSDVIGLLDYLKIEGKVVVVGHSMGGIVASEIAATSPDRVRGVVLIGPVNPQPQLSGVFEQRIEAVKKGGLEGLAGSIPTAATGKNSTPLHHAFIRSLILGTPPEGYISLCRVISNAKQPSYAAISVPLVIIAGNDDKTAPMEACEEILESYGTSQDSKKIEKIYGVGHWQCVEAPEEVQHYIELFLRSVF